MIRRYITGTLVDMAREATNKVDDKTKGIILLGAGVASILAGMNLFRANKEGK